MSYSLDQKIRARELFVESGQTYEQVAAATGISSAALKAWGKEGNWQQERDEFEKEVLGLNGNLQKLKVKLAREALDKGDPQKIYALANLLRATVGASGARPTQEDKAAQFLDWMGKLLDYLKEKDQEALRYLSPHIRNFADSIKAS